MWLAVLPILGLNSYTFYNYNANVADYRVRMRENERENEIVKKLFTPTAVIGLSLIGSRLAAGTLGLMAKGSSMLANKTDRADLAQKLDNAGNQLNAFATRSIKHELILLVGVHTVITSLFALTIINKETPQAISILNPYSFLPKEGWLPQIG